MYVNGSNIERTAMRKVVETVALKQGMSATDWVVANGFATGAISPANTKSMTLDTMFKLCRALDVKPSKFVEALDELRKAKGL